MKIIIEIVEKPDGGPLAVAMLARDTDKMTPNEKEFAGMLRDLISSMIPILSDMVGRKRVTELHITRKPPLEGP